MRLIDADAIRREIDCCDFDSQTDKLTICQQISEAPTIDAVPVVRCRECRSYNKPRLGWCSVHLDREGPDDFCSYGEMEVATQ